MSRFDIFSFSKKHITTSAKAAKTIIAGGFAVALIAATFFLNTDGVSRDTVTDTAQQTVFAKSSVNKTHTR
ncbi:MAG TPA: hypothetical protein VM867_06920 [Xanthobacteraceae bacterium]|nr:hypothetical protein [Xanthobacteraceae bacterium]